LAKISSVLRNFPKKNWEDYENIRSAFVYVLSGGDYGVLQPLIESGVLSEADKTLAEGIGLYARGQSSAARKILLDIDPRSLDVSLVGPFALARASFYIGHDNKKAIEFLDEARLAAPHTAIEEAAVRREIALLVEAGDRPRAVMLMADYVRRFGKSIYAWKLFQDFATALAKQDDQDGSGVVEDLASTTTTADKNARTKLFLNLAGEALLYGKIVLAKAAAKATLHLKPESQIDVDKATLYEAAASAPTANAERALKTLNGLAGDHLSDDDSEIHEVADYIARTVSGDDIKADAKPGVRPIGPAADAKRSASSLALPRVAGAIESADAALKHADMLISRNEQ
jgi:chemotaxis protein MotC